MSAHQLIAGITWAVFLALFATTAVEAIRRPSRTQIDIALLFAAPAVVIGLALAASAGLVARDQSYGALLATFQLAMPFMTLRLARDFATVRGWAVRLALLGLLALAVAAFFPPPEGRPWLFPAQFAYFAGLQLYGAVAFGAESRRAVGITRRRLRSAAAGAAILGLAPLAALMRPLGEGWLIIYELANLVAGSFYFLGFAPPGLLRRTWQDPELRAFLRSTAGLAQLADEREVLRALERGAAAALGAPYARIGLWDEEQGGLRFEGEPELLPAGAGELARRVFFDQRPRHADGFARLQLALVAGAAPLGATMAAPLTSGQRRFGVLIVYSEREALFARDDLAVVALLAAQAAGVLESRALTADLARVQARAETTRLKEDFLSAAAHDLKTPLTTLLAQAQLLDRRLQRRPEAPPDGRSVALIVQSAERLRYLIANLLDASRAEHGQLVGPRVTLDLAALAGEICAAYATELHPCAVSADGPVRCVGDRARLAQLLGCLLDNAVKFSPRGGAITVEVMGLGDEALLRVCDQGIGIAAGDMPHLFERFYRGGNVDDRSFAGMGLSLAICRAIAEQHGGRIWTESRLGAGSIFSVALPLSAEGAG
ncbi:MAG TPA: HAMP domain-containing sensor histidine kinase [Chloroflexaceae bacterium]|nr:HAMP domain-containing sensor histidine kinase [Chloroflexaceae bacterium]